MIIWSMIFDRTELIIGPSKAKNGQESFAEIHFVVSPKNPDQISEKRISETETTPEKQMSDVQK